MLSISISDCIVLTLFVLFQEPQLQSRKSHKLVVLDESCEQLQHLYLHYTMDLPGIENQSIT